MLFTCLSWWITWIKHNFIQVTMKNYKKVPVSLIMRFYIKLLIYICFMSKLQYIYLKKSYPIRGNINIQRLWNFWDNLHCTFLKFAHEFLVLSLAEYQTCNTKKKTVEWPFFVKLSCRLQNEIWRFSIEDHAFKFNF